MPVSYEDHMSNDKCNLLLREGVPRHQFSSVAKNIAMIPEKELADYAGISQRTISRLKPDDLLSLQAAEVIISIMRTYQRAVEVFESEDMARKWLKTPIAYLGDKTPLQSMANRFGAEMVLDMLGRIEHGVYS